MEHELIAAELSTSSLVTWVGCPLEIAEKMLELAHTGPNDVVYDLGSGDGRVLIMAVKYFGALKAVGYEIRKNLIDATRLASDKLGLQPRIEVVQQNLLEADVSKASIVIIYLSSEANGLLRPQLERDAMPGTRIVTYLFPINGWSPTTEVDLQEYSFTEDNFVGKLYLYHIPQAFESGPWKYR